MRGSTQSAVPAGRWIGIVLRRWPLAARRAGWACVTRGDGRLAGRGDGAERVGLGGAGCVRGRAGDAQGARELGDEHQPDEQARHGPDGGQREEPPSARPAGTRLRAEVDGGENEIPPRHDRQRHAGREDEQDGTKLLLRPRPSARTYAFPMGHGTIVADGVSILGQAVRLSRPRSAGDRSAPPGDTARTSPELAEVPGCLVGPGRRAEPIHRSRIGPVARWPERLDSARRRAVPRR